MEALGCNIYQSIDEQVQCLQSIDPDSIRSDTEYQIGYMGAQAVVDSSFSSTPFLPDHPRQLMIDGSYNKDVNVLLGSNRFVTEFYLTKYGRQNNVMLPYTCCIILVTGYLLPDICHMIFVL